MVRLRADEVILKYRADRTHIIMISEMPQGGYKPGGYGKDMSLYTFEDYTEIKHVFVDLTDQNRKTWHYIVFGSQ